ncbi:hypothetical protein ILYODFUR_035837, partial [Ilyodon furcidens]
GDQGLLNSFFSCWSVGDIGKHLPFIYNLCANSLYSYLPAFQQFGHQAKIVHFAGAVKPWSSQRNDSRSHIMEQFESLWWKEYHCHTMPPVSNTHPTPSRQKQQRRVKERSGAARCETHGERGAEGAASEAGAKRERSGAMDELKNQNFFLNSCCVNQSGTGCGCDVG